VSSLSVPFSIRAVELFIAPQQIEVAPTHIKHIKQFMQFDILRCMIVPALRSGYSRDADKR
jgi:hypothetical protein